MAAGLTIPTPPPRLRFNAQGSREQPLLRRPPLPSEALSIVSQAEPRREGLPVCNVYATSRLWPRRRGS